MKVEEELKKIQKLLEKRYEDYGPTLESFERITKLWNAYLGQDYIRIRDIPMMMILLKISRQSNRFKIDNLRDIIGYALLELEYESC